MAQNQNLSNTVKNLTVSLDNRTHKLKELQSKFEKLQSEFYHSDQQQIISDNNREQYCWNWCLPFFGINVLQDVIDKLGLNVAFMVTVFNRIVKPVMEFAIKRILSTLPVWFDVLEIRHFVGKAHKSYYVLI